MPEWKKITKDTRYVIYTRYLLGVLEEETNSEYKSINYVELVERKNSGLINVNTGQPTNFDKFATHYLNFDNIETEL
jgi:hypothetical protein